MNDNSFPRAYEGNEPYIFFSYSHRDSDTVIPIVTKMQESGFRIWYDQGIEAGSEWAEYISNHILGCSVFVALLSENYDSSPNCHDEVHMAKAYRKDILSIYLNGYSAEMLKGELQLWLGRMQAIFYERHPDLDSFVNALIQSKLLAATNANVPKTALAKKPAAQTSTPAPFNSSTETLLKRVALFLENGEWSNADAYCEKVLDMDPGNAKAYLYKLLAQLHGKKEEDLAFCNTSLDKITAYKTALRFADEETASRLREYNRKVNERLAIREKERQELARKKLELQRQEEQAMQEQERERQRRAEQKRLEYDSLRDARDKAERLITHHTREKQHIQNTISQKQKELVQMGNYKKMREFSIAVLALLVFNIIIIVSIVSNPSAGKTLLLLGGLLAGMILSAKMLKAGNMPRALVWINLVTYGCFSVVTAIVLLVKSKKYQTLQSAKNQELASLQNQLRQVDVKINAARASFGEAQKKLDIYQ